RSREIPGAERDRPRAVVHHPRPAVTAAEVDGHVRRIESADGSGIGVQRLADEAGDVVEQELPRSGIVAPMPTPGLMFRTVPSGASMTNVGKALVPVAWKTFQSNAVFGFAGS